MKVLESCIWVYPKGYANNHELHLLVDKVPELEEMRFERKDDLWYAEKDGYVSYYYWKPPNNNGGFYGRNFEITMKNGERVILKGPWSSRCSVINEFFKPNCIEVCITDDARMWDHGKGTCCAGAVTVDFAKNVLSEYYPDWTIVGNVDEFGEIHYKIVRKDDLNDTRDNAWFREFFKTHKYPCLYPNEKIEHVTKKDAWDAWKYLIDYYAVMKVILIGNVIRGKIHLFLGKYRGYATGICAYRYAPHIYSGEYELFTIRTDEILSVLKKGGFSGKLNYEPCNIVTIEIR